MKLTPWFDGNVKPVRTGVYAREGKAYSYWDGKYWGWTSGSAELAYFQKDSRSMVQRLPWRGILKSPQEILNIYTKKLRDSIKLHGGK